NRALSSSIHAQRGLSSICSLMGIILHPCKVYARHDLGLQQFPCSSSSPALTPLAPNSATRFFPAPEFLAWLYWLDEELVHVWEVGRCGPGKNNMPQAYKLTGVVSG